MKPEIPTTWYHRAVNLLCLILLVGIFAVLFIFWRDLPEQIPAHYDAFGRVDRWGGRGELLLCPVRPSGHCGGGLVCRYYPAGALSPDLEHRGSGDRCQQGGRIPGVKKPNCHAQAGDGFHICVHCSLRCAGPAPPGVVPACRSDSNLRSAGPVPGPYRPGRAGTVGEESYYRLEECL